MTLDAIKKQRNAMHLLGSGLLLLALTGCAGADGSDGAAAGQGESRSSQSALKAPSAGDATHAQSAFPDCCALHWVDMGPYPYATCEGIGIHDVDYGNCAAFECNANPSNGGTKTWELWEGFSE